MGLAITQRLVNALGGTVGVTSQIGKGSRFWFTLPMKRAETLHRLAHASASGALKLERGAIAEAETGADEGAEPASA